MIESSDKLPPLGGQCSNGKAVVNVILTAIGVGIVFLPSVMTKCGWIGGPIVLLTSALMTIYSTWLLNFSLTKNPKGFQESFPSLADSLFGTRTKWFTAVNLNGTLVLICAVLLILIGQSVERVAGFADTTGYWRWFALGAGVIAMPLTWLKTMNEIGWVSAVGVVTLLAFIGVVVTGAFIRLGKTGRSTFLVSEKAEQAPLDYVVSYLQAFAIAFVSYFMSSCVPTLIKDMRKPDSFPLVSKVGNGSVFAIYFILSIACYAAWGTSNDKDGVLKTMEKNMADSQYMSIVADCMLVLTGIPHFIALILPASVAADPIFKNFSKKIPCAYIVGRSLVITFIIIISLIDKDAKLLVGLVGGVTAIILSIYLPVLFYVRVKSLRGEPLRLVEKIALPLFVVFGVCVMVTSVINSVNDIIEKFKK